MVFYNMIMLGETSIPVMVRQFMPIVVVKDWNSKSINASPSRVKISVLDISRIFVRFGSKFG